MSPSRDPSERAARGRFLALVVLLAVLAAAVAVGHLGGWLTRESIEAFVRAGGAWAPVVYVVVASLLVAAWAPRGLLSVVAGALFGPGLGGLLALAMGATGAMIGYGLARRLGKDYVGGKARGRSARVLAFVRRRGFWAVFACRVCPLVPSELISATSGAAAIPFRRFLAATLLGMAPTAFLYAAFGGSLLDPDAAWLTWGSLGLFALLTIGTGLGLRRLWLGDAGRGEASDPAL